MPSKEHDLLYSLGESELEKLVKDKPEFSLFLEALREYNIEMELFQRVPEEELAARVSQNPVTLSSVFDRLEKFSNGKVEDVVEPAHGTGGAARVTGIARPQFLVGSERRTIKQPDPSLRRWWHVNGAVCGLSTGLAAATPALETLLLHRDPLKFAGISHMAFYTASALAALGIGWNYRKRMGKVQSGEEAFEDAQQDTLPWYSRYWRKFTRSAIFPVIALAGLGVGMIRQSTAYYMNYKIIQKHEQQQEDTKRKNAQISEYQQKTKFAFAYGDAKKMEKLRSSGSLPSNEESAELYREGMERYADYKAGRIPWPALPTKSDYPSAPLKKWDYPLQVQEVLHPLEYTTAPPWTASLSSLEYYLTEYQIGYDFDENDGRVTHDLFSRKEGEFFAACEEMIFGEPELLMALYYNLGSIKRLSSEAREPMNKNPLGVGAFDPRAPGSEWDQEFVEHLKKHFLKPLSKYLQATEGKLDDALYHFVYTPQEIEQAKEEARKEPKICIGECLCEPEFYTYRSFLPKTSRKKSSLREEVPLNDFVFYLMRDYQMLKRYHIGLRNKKEQNNNELLPYVSPHQEIDIYYPESVESNPEYSSLREHCQQLWEENLGLSFGGGKVIHPGQHTTFFVGIPTSKSYGKRFSEKLVLLEYTLEIQKLGWGDGWSHGEPIGKTYGNNRLIIPMFTPTGTYEVKLVAEYGDEENPLPRCTLELTTDLIVTNKIPLPKK